jgi:hypothetical protein
MQIIKWSTFTQMVKILKSVENRARILSKEREKMLMPD